MSLVGARAGWDARATLFLLVCGAAVAQPGVVSLREPYGAANPLVSPDRAYALFGSDPADAQLWIEDLRTHQRRMVFRVTLQTLTLAWSPDSDAFVANDRAASDIETAWLYDAKSLERLDLRRLILAADPAAAQFCDPAVHSYVHASRWQDASHVAVRLFGHTNGVRMGNAIRPGDCFHLRYRIGRDGVVQKVAQHVMPIGPNGCPAEEER
jgi:hypothetical protein